MNRWLKIGLVLLLFLGSAPLVYAQTTHANGIAAKSSFNPTNPAEPNPAPDDNNEEEEEVITYYKVTVSSTPSSAGNVPSGGQFTNGSSKYVYTSSKDSKYEFSHWTLNGEFYSNSLSFTYKVGTEDVDFVAHYKFVPSSPIEPDLMPEEPEIPEKKISSLYLTTNIEGACSFNQSSGNEYEEDSWVGLEAFVAKGYEFKGWYNGTTFISNDTQLNYQMPNESTTLIAYVEKIVYNPLNPSEPEGSQDDVAVGSYNLIYVVDGKEYETILVKFGTPIIPLAPLYKEGYTFSGWSEVPEIMPARDVVVTGAFTVNSYTITYIVNGEEYKSITYKYGESLLVENAPVKEGYTFNGWRFSTLQTYDIDIANNADAMLYTNAKCTNTSYGDEFKGWHVLFDNNSNTFFHSEYSNVESKDGLDHYLRVDLGENNELSKFAFTYTLRGTIPQNGNYSPKVIVVEGSNIKDGNYVEIKTLSQLPSIGGEIYESPILSSGVAYRYIRFRVTETFTNVKVKGHPYFFMAEFGMTGYKQELSEEVNTGTVIPNKDVVLVGSYTINSYSLTYQVDGEVYKKETVDYGAALPTPIVPTKEGYTFSGWSEAPETMPAGDVTIYGTFLVNQYVATYMVDGELFATETIDYGADITVPEIPEKEGYTFSWIDEIPETMPSEDITIYGVYNENETTDIESTTMRDGKLYIYTIDGKRTYDLRQGINIVKMRGGRVRKILVK